MIKDAAGLQFFCIWELYAAIMDEAFNDINKSISNVCINCNCSQTGVTWDLFFFSVAAPLTT